MNQIWVKRSNQTDRHMSRKEHSPKINNPKEGDSTSNSESL